MARHLSLPYRAVPCPLGFLEGEPGSKPPVSSSCRSQEAGGGVTCFLGLANRREQLAISLVVILSEQLSSHQLVCLCFQTTVTSGGSSGQAPQNLLKVPKCHPVSSSPGLPSLIARVQSGSFRRLYRRFPFISCSTQKNHLGDTGLVCPGSFVSQRVPGPFGSKQAAASSRDDSFSSSQLPVSSSDIPPDSSIESPMFFCAQGDEQVPSPSLSVSKSIFSPVPSHTLSSGFVDSSQGTRRKTFALESGAPWGEDSQCTYTLPAQEAAQSKIVLKTPFISSEVTTALCHNETDTERTGYLSQTMQYSQGSDREREGRASYAGEMSLDVDFGVDKSCGGAAPSRISSPSSGHHASEDPCWLASVIPAREKGTAVIPARSLHSTGDSQTPTLTVTSKPMDAGAGARPCGLGCSFVTEVEAGRGNGDSRRNQDFLAAVPPVPPSPVGLPVSSASRRQSARQSSALARSDTRTCGSTRHATGNPGSSMTRQQAPSSPSMCCPRILAVSPLVLQPVILPPSSRALAGLPSSPRGIASSPSSSSRKGSSLAFEQEEDVLVPVSHSQTQGKMKLFPDSRQDSPRGPRVCVSVPFTCTSPPCRPSSPVSFYLSRPRKSRAPSSSPSRVMNASLQNLTRAPPPLSTSRAARSIIVSSQQAASKSCAFSDARGPGSPPQHNARGGARALVASSLTQGSLDSRARCSVRSTLAPHGGPGIAGTNPSLSSSVSLGAATVKDRDPPVGLKAKYAARRGDREAVRTNPERLDRGRGDERRRRARQRSSGSSSEEERGLLSEGQLHTPWSQGLESTRHQARYTLSSSKLNAGQGDIFGSRRWRGGDFLVSRGNSRDPAGSAMRRILQRETAAAAVAAAAVEGRGDIARGPDSENFLMQRSTFSGMCKWLQHRFYGRGELERLCGVYSPHEVERVVLQSKTLSRKDKHKLMLLTLSGNSSSFEELLRSSDSSASSTGRSLMGGSRRRRATRRRRRSLVSRESPSDCQREHSGGRASDVSQGDAKGKKKAGRQLANERRRLKGRTKESRGLSRTASPAMASGSERDVVSSRGEKEGRRRDGGYKEREGRTRAVERGRSGCRSVEGTLAFSTYEERTRGRENIGRERQPRRQEIASDHSAEEALAWEDQTERAVLEECVEEVQKKKLVKDAENFRIGFLRNLAALRGVAFAVQHLSTLQRRPVDSGDVEHQEKFSRLWGLLMPRQRLPGRICKEWKELGFQGEDPATDFRGCGQLGLDSLVFLASRFPTHARAMLEASHDSRYWYSFAITSINVTSWVWEWLVQRRPQVAAFFFCAHIPEAAELAFHFLFSYVFTHFHHFWFSRKPASIMEFPFVAGEFKQTVRLPSTLPACALLSPRGICNSDERREEAWCYMAAVQAYQRARKLRDECREDYDGSGVGPSLSFISPVRSDGQGSGDKVSAEGGNAGTNRATGEGISGPKMRSSRDEGSGVVLPFPGSNKSSNSIVADPSGRTTENLGACKQRNQSLLRKWGRFSLESISPRRASKDTEKDWDDREEGKGNHNTCGHDVRGTNTAVKPKNGSEPRSLGFLSGNSLNLPFRLLGSASSTCFGRGEREGSGSGCQGSDHYVSSVASERHGATGANLKASTAGVENQSECVGREDERTDRSTTSDGRNKRWGASSQKRTGSFLFSNERMENKQNQGLLETERHFGACPCCVSWHPLGGDTGTSVQGCAGTDRRKGGRSRSLRRLPSCLQWARSSSRKRYSSNGFRFPAICRGRSGVADESSLEKRKRLVQGEEGDGENRSSSSSVSSEEEGSRRQRRARSIRRRPGRGFSASSSSSCDEAENAVERRGFKKRGERNARMYRHLSSVSRRSTSHKDPDENSLTAESGSSVRESSSGTSRSRSSSPEPAGKKETSRRATAGVSCCGREADSPFASHAAGRGGRPPNVGSVVAPSSPVRKSRELLSQQHPRLSAASRKDLCPRRGMVPPSGGVTGDSVDHVVYQIAAEGQGSTYRDGLNKEHPLLFPVRPMVAPGGPGPATWNRQPAGGVAEHRPCTMPSAIANPVGPSHSVCGSDPRSNYGNAIETQPPHPQNLSVNLVSVAVPRPLQAPSRGHYPSSVAGTPGDSIRDEAGSQEAQLGPGHQNLTSSRFAGLSTSNSRGSHELFRSASVASSLSSLSSTFVSPGPTATAAAPSGGQLGPARSFVQQSYNLGGSSSSTGSGTPLFLSPVSGAPSGSAFAVDDRPALRQKGMQHSKPGGGQGLYCDASRRGSRGPSQQLQGSVQRISESTGGHDTGDATAVIKGPAFDLLS
ncbi:elmo domain-containing protein 2 [Cystoisospora suis]|uniref:Elmo domain-containing protein 2 n=1 Tax=Cystoisospora suis TaxID=483139 RepID=A0A2C6L6X6_9APIC|nr:elmo domain-containing protein 2 [Cystoisospora suis]